jgi:short-subunit dehydrogenase
MGAGHRRVGREFCRQLAAMDYHLVLVARRADRLHTLATELRQAFGTACLILPTDLSEPGAPAAIARQLEKEGVEVEFLVNNAGYGIPTRFVETDWRDHTDFIQVMVTAVCDLTWRLLPSMQAAGRGHVINVSSAAGLISGSKGATLYGASKAFLVSFSESLALENESMGVKVSALCPGFTYSEFHDVSGTREKVNRLPSYMWQNAEDVVRFGIESVTREKPRVVAVPGLYYRLLVAAHRHFPGLGRHLIGRMSRRFRMLD